MRKSNGFSARQLTNSDLHPLLCGVALTLSAKGYFNDNKEKFNFFKFNIIDCEEEQAKRENIKRNKKITDQGDHYA